MARKSKSISKIVITTLGLAGLLSSCAKSLVNYRYFSFDTVIDVKYDGESEFGTALNQPFDHLSDLFDTYKAIPSLINAYSINNANDYLEVEKDLYDILYLANDYFLDTDGLFNPLIKDVSELWKSSLANNKLPDESKVSEMMETILASSLEFKDGNKVMISGEGQIDLGAIAKGYALMKIKPLFAQNEITNYIVNAGNSSILLGENNENNGYYRVGINNSNNKYLELKNTSIGTSSIYEQKYVEKDGKIYSHIVNGITGSAEVKHHMVIVVDDDPILCDVYSTVGMLSTISEIQTIEKMTGLKFITFSSGEPTYVNAGLEVKTR